MPDSGHWVDPWAVFVALEGLEAGVPGMKLPVWLQGTAGKVDGALGRQRGRGRTESMRALSDVLGGRASDPGRSQQSGAL